ncbi:VOC family protein [Aerococcus sanguinicola]|uniref:VOC family protein n=1 Tax=unclassified Aerococcus TaxID=2618060 RepID=UPI0008A29A14|nr:MULTISPECIES: VOC family protein [unclassified Aerococcus]KAB0645769.1 VOC family protein [Aerococcus sanguinicola]MDK6234317.1 VOC family protein [Aerococcus sp. UMB10185]OFN01284.1 hypothetical protein HMPREF2626_07955 [Aerococcus sp. HMSC062A02]OHO44411.1 hypothetical protein HMPREF2705_06940 [Aerococcus sp. HMSC035B07]
MTRHVTESATQVTTKAVAINALDPKALADFYQETIGLSLIEAKADAYYLGTPDGQVLLEIYPTDERKKDYTGLYHMAFLLPSRKDLANNFKHLLQVKAPLEGASDHGYSEALYLQDPEDNGIEIYADKDQAEWDINESGAIAGIVEPIAAEEVLALADPGDYQGMPNGTIMGHIHLHVHDIEETMNFYYDVMGLGVKFLMGKSALFMATGDYHHHLGANVWRKGIDPQADYTSQGLRESIWQGSQEDLDWVEDQLKAKAIDYDKDGSSLIFHDPAQTQIRLVLA